MKMTQMVDVTTREDWRRWLAAHHDVETEVWLIYPKRHTRRPGVVYEDAVEEALCYGWIDSIVQRLDDERYAQKFTPRKATSKWSTLNRRRFARLVKTGRMTKAGLAKAPPPGAARGTPEVKERGQAADHVPAYIASALKKHPRAWLNFKNLAPSYRRKYVRWIDAAKRDDTRARRLMEAIGLLEDNQKLGLK